MCSRALVLGFLVLASCSGQLLQRQPASPLELRYRAWSQGEKPEGAAVSTSVYREIFSKSMYSQCQMVPHDSSYFDTLVKRCGGVQAIFRGAARLLLERAANTDFLTPVRHEGRLKWLDLVGNSPCD